MSIYFGLYDDIAFLSHLTIMESIFFLVYRQLWSQNLYCSFKLLTVNNSNLIEIIF